MPFLLQPRRFHPLKTLFVLAVLTAFTLYVGHRDRKPRLWMWNGPAFGSSYTVKIVDKRIGESDVVRLHGETVLLLAEINGQMSTYDPASEISRFNDAASVDPFTVSEPLADLVTVALDLHARSGGAFDPTYFPLFKLWGFGKDGLSHTVPAPEAFASTRQLCGAQHLCVPAPNRIRKDIPGLQFNLNAIAPGHAADRVTALLAQNGLTNVYVEVGGEIMVRGVNLEGNPWRIGVEKPTYAARLGESIESIVNLSDRALATSGDYRSFFKDGAGRVHGHIFDPRIGRPVTSQVASVSVIATNCTLADGLATTLFVLGPEEGLPWLTNYPGSEAFFIVRNEDGSFSEIRSGGFPRDASDP
ncbi:MAG: FAD:protein FMN transferase [bacterium]